MPRHLLSLLDWSGAEIFDALKLAHNLKRKTKTGACPKLLEGRSYALIFHKNSLRTRVSFEVGIHQLGGHSMILTDQDFKIGERESVRDVAKVLSRYVDGILIRTSSHETVVALAEHAEVPMVNMLTDFSHPCQILADVLTIQEHVGTLENLRIAYLGDGNNVVNSWLNLACRIPLDLRIGTAPETQPEAALVKAVQDCGVSQVRVCHDAREAVADAQILYTDVWASMGEKEQACQRGQLLQDFQINQNLLECAAQGVKVMHCLPAERGREITEEVLEGANSIVLDQAENRLHAQKAVLAQLERWHRSL